MEPFFPVSIVKRLRFQVAFQIVIKGNVSQKEMANMAMTSKILIDVRGINLVSHCK